MKLVIEIPEEDYQLRKRIASRHGAMNMVDIAIANGKPLDTVLGEIKTEIKALTDGLEPEHIWNVDVLQIIDKYKAESEG